MKNSTAKAPDLPALFSLGEGILTWARSERITDRYGFIYLIRDGGSSLSDERFPSLIFEEAARPLEGQRGRLYAKVLGTRESTHIGDLGHGFYPTKTAAGAMKVLGTGALALEPAPEGGVAVGLKPSDKRGRFWLDPKALYAVHEHLVELMFEPEA